MGRDPHPRATTGGEPSSCGLMQTGRREGDDSCPAASFRSRIPDEPSRCQIEALQALMNHSRIDTTQVYLRALNRSKAMEAVRDLSWGLGFHSEAEEAHTGFEPVLLSDALIERVRQKQALLHGGSKQE